MFCRGLSDRPKEGAPLTHSAEVSPLAADTPWLRLNQSESRSRGGPDERTVLLKEFKSMNASEEVFATELEDMCV